jgi:hypothetical protein
MGIDELEIIIIKLSQLTGDSVELCPIMLKDSPHFQSLKHFYDNYEKIESAESKAQTTIEQIITACLVTMQNACKSYADFLDVNIKYELISVKSALSVDELISLHSQFSQSIFTANKKVLNTYDVFFASKKPPLFQKLESELGSNPYQIIDAGLMTSLEQSITFKKKRKAKRVAIIEEGPKSTLPEESIEAENNYKLALEKAHGALLKLQSLKFEKYLEKDIILGQLIQKMVHYVNVIKELPIKVTEKLKPNKSNWVNPFELKIQIYNKACKILKLNTKKADSLYNKLVERFIIIEPHISSRDAMIEKTKIYENALRLSLANYIIHLHSLKLPEADEQLLKTLLKYEIEVIAAQFADRLPQLTEKHQFAALLTSITGTEGNFGKLKKVFSSQEKIEHTVVSLSEYAKTFFGEGTVSADSSRSNHMENLAGLAHLKTLLEKSNLELIKIYSINYQTILINITNIKKANNALLLRTKQAKEIHEIKNKISTSSRTYSQEITQLHEIDSEIELLEQRVKDTYEKLKNIINEYKTTPLSQLNGGSVEQIAKALKGSLANLDTILNAQVSNMQTIKELELELSQLNEKATTPVEKLKDYWQTEVSIYSHHLKKKKRHAIKARSLIDRNEKLQLLDEELNNKIIHFLEKCTPYTALSSLEIEKKFLESGFEQIVKKVKEELKEQYEPILKRLKFNSQIQIRSYHPINPFAEPLNESQDKVTQTYDAIIRQFNRLSYLDGDDLPQWDKYLVDLIISLDGTRNNRKDSHIYKRDTLQRNADIAEIRINSDLMQTSFMIVQEIRQEFDRIIDKYLERTLSRWESHEARENHELLQNLPHELFNAPVTEDTIKAMNLIDPRLKRLIYIKSEFERINDDYINLRSKLPIDNQKKEYTNKLSDTIINCIHNDTMEDLSEGKKSKWLQWMRVNVLKPLSQFKHFLYHLIKRTPEPIYKTLQPVTFFATKTERELIETGIKSLQSLRGIVVAA